MIDLKKLPPLEATAPALAFALKNRSLIRRLFPLIFRPKTPKEIAAARREAIRSAIRLRIGKVIPFIRPRD
jgi:hypothetical protein